MTEVQGVSCGCDKTRARYKRWRQNLPQRSRRSQRKQEKKQRPVGAASFASKFEPAPCLGGTFTECGIKALPDPKDSLITRARASGQKFCFSLGGRPSCSCVPANGSRRPWNEGKNGNCRQQRPVLCRHEENHLLVCASKTSGDVSKCPLMRNKDPFAGTRADSRELRFDHY